MKKSIRTRIFACFGLLMLLIVISQTVFNLFLAKPYFVQKKISVIESSFYELSNNYSDNLNEVNTLAMDLQDTHSIKITLLKNSEIIYSNSRFEMERKNHRLSPDEIFNPDDISFSETPETVVMNEDENGMSTIRLTGKFSYNNEDINVVMSLPIASIDNSVSMFMQVSMIISAFALFIGIIISIMLSKSITSPITSVEKVAQSLSNLDFSEYADESVSSRELSNLAVSINAMSYKLQNSIEQLQIANKALQKDIDYQKQIEKLRREFIANVSHEMKTPLGLLQIYTENLKNNIDDIDKDYYCDVIIEETNNLNEMVKSMLDISSIESGLSKMSFKTFDLSELCSQTISKFSPVFQDYTVCVCIERKISIDGDKKYLEQAIKNYISNAVNHTQKGNKIEISLINQNDTVLFSVENQGKHIDDADISNIWDAFYKSDKARTRTNNNVGLGLYIVKTVIDRHSGKYGVENTPNGVKFYFSLPIQSI